MFNFALLMRIHMIMFDTLMSLKSLHKHECLVPVFVLEMYKLMPLRKCVMFAASLHLHLLFDQEYLIGGQTIPVSPLVIYRVLSLDSFPSYNNTQKPLGNSYAFGIVIQGKNSDQPKQIETCLMIIIWSMKGFYIYVLFKTQGNIQLHRKLAYLLQSLAFLLIIICLILQDMSIMFRMTESAPIETIDTIIGIVNVNACPAIGIPKQTAIIIGI